MNSPIDNGSATVTLPLKSGDTVVALVLGRFSASTPGGESFPLLVTQLPEETYAAVTESYTGQRVCQVAAHDFAQCGQNPTAAGKQAFERLVSVQGWARVASALRACRGTV